MLVLPYPGDDVEAKLSHAHSPFPDRLDGLGPNTISECKIWREEWIKEENEEATDDENDGYEEENPGSGKDFTAFEIDQADQQFQLKQEFNRVLLHYANGVNPITPYPDLLVRSMLLLRWARPMSVSIEITHLLNLLRKIALIGSYERFRQSSKAEDVVLTKELVEVHIAALTNLVYSVTNLGDWRLAVEGRYADEDLNQTELGTMTDHLS